MTRTLKLLLIPTLLGVWCEGAAAQVAVTSSPRKGDATVTLEQALQRSLRYNPEIAKLDANLADKLGRAIEAEVKLNPSFKVGGGYVSEEAGTGGAFALEVEQPLRPSDFGLRKTYAAALRAAATLEQKADVLRVLNATALIYYRAWALQERAALLTGARAQAEDVLTTIQQQLEAGQSSVSQRSIFEAETARFAAELIAVRGERAGAHA
ncbi:MAG TPA: TolC family protein, partial [Chthoniobacterales bacterium]|nr:TolC family protein [Chthoniobacterales bacterium]